MLLLALFDLDDLVGNAAVGFPVDGLSRFFARGFAQTKDSAFRFVEPILQVFYAVLSLNLKILRCASVTASVVNFELRFRRQL